VLQFRRMLQWTPRYPKGRQSPANDPTLQNYDWYIQNSIQHEDTEFVDIDRKIFLNLQFKDLVQVLMDSSGSKFLPIKLGTFFPQLSTYWIAYSGIEKFQEKISKTCQRWEF
jgi:hypothetical protein